MPRFFCPAPLHTGDLLDLPSGAARHVQVLRLQPGDSITLFNHGPGWDGASPGGEFEARVTLMGRSQVQVEIGSHQAVEREARRAVHLAVGMPANERMDWLVEKAAELGVASIQPLMTERSVLRLAAERATKKVEHWQSVAIAACEQCGGNRVPLVHGVKTLAQWLAAHNATDTDAPRALLLSLREGTQLLQGMDLGTSSALFLSGPEGGLSVAEESAAVAAGFAPVTLGARVLRSETAAITALALLA
ncbi:16S rRNA (uracil(1498)-N(3))-methyltransferase [Rhodoferax lacus]|uniref:Ribosomal RNA small subunit methyltransferase E n=1 Tax=Rhodoferax lacus TaxID=2184758 RepID=A0A3E1RAR3_9BURK|nr:16S rRNA (uracil(1498)-N(3))-methyltransferase [Rhodoferax lacus]RFO96459.1 16S rRNA (uracil(1498)-N(3))-methyltransferase [Rhodoferax lacus]